MSEELENLSSLGAQKIYEDTHIPIQHVQAILHYSFDGFTKVQFLGFISILEREYHQPLPQLKANGLEYFDEQEKPIADDGLFVSPSKKKNNNKIYIFIALFFLIAVVVYNFSETKKPISVESSIDDSTIESATEKIEPEVVVSDINTTEEKNATVETEEINATQEVLPEPAAVPDSFTIVAKSKVWFGYIDRDTNKKYQKTFKGEVTLDPHKRWLLLFGHGYIDMFVDGELQKFNSRSKTRFLYENGVLTAISAKEFKQLNRGRKW